MHTQLVPVHTTMVQDVSVCTCFVATRRVLRDSKRSLVSPRTTPNMTNPKTHKDHVLSLASVYPAIPSAPSPPGWAHRRSVQQQAGGTVTHLLGQSSVIRNTKGRYRQERTYISHRLEPGHKHHRNMLEFHSQRRRCSQTHRRRRCSRRRWEAGWAGRDQGCRCRFHTGHQRLRGLQMRRRPVLLLAWRCCIHLPGFQWPRHRWERHMLHIGPCNRDHR